MSFKPRRKRLSDEEKLLKRKEIEERQRKLFELRQKSSLPQNKNHQYERLGSSAIAIHTREDWDIRNWQRGFLLGDGWLTTRHYDYNLVDGTEKKVLYGSICIGQTFANCPKPDPIFPEYAFLKGWEVYSKNNSFLEDISRGDGIVQNLLEEFPDLMYPTRRHKNRAESEQKWGPVWEAKIEGRAELCDFLRTLRPFRDRLSPYSQLAWQRREIEGYVAKYEKYEQTPVTPWMLVGLREAEGCFYFDLYSKKSSIGQKTLEYEYTEKAVFSFSVTQGLSIDPGKGHYFLLRRAAAFTRWAVEEGLISPLFQDHRQILGVITRHNHEEEEASVFAWELRTAELPVLFTFLTQYPLKFPSKRRQFEEGRCLWRVRGVRAMEVQYESYTDSAWYERTYRSRPSAFWHKPWCWENEFTSWVYSKGGRASSPDPHPDYQEQVKNLPEWSQQLVPKMPHKKRLKINLYNSKAFDWLTPTLLCESRLRFGDREFILCNRKFKKTVLVRHTSFLDVGLLTKYIQPIAKQRGIKLTKATVQRIRQQRILPETAFYPILRLNKCIRVGKFSNYPDIPDDF